LDKGDRIGTLHVQMAPDQPVMQLPLVAGQDVPALGWFARTMAKAIYAVTGKGL
jgi:hypothetical protein